MEDKTPMILLGTGIAVLVFGIIAYYMTQQQPTPVDVSPGKVTGT